MCKWLYARMCKRLYARRDPRQINTAQPKLGISLWHQLASHDGSTTQSTALPAPPVTRRKRRAPRSRLTPVRDVPTTQSTALPAPPVTCRKRRAPRSRLTPVRDVPTTQSTALPAPPVTCRKRRAPRSRLTPVGTSQQRRHRAQRSRPRRLRAENAGYNAEHRAPGPHPFER